ncbi:MAG: glycoside hydrolase family 27 protein, partial [Acidobacteriota bacterium]|nr:glycoside hydrolase family 27 protein [Acidobacteriota bacterium]
MPKPHMRPIRIFIPIGWIAAAALLFAAGPSPSKPQAAPAKIHADGDGLALTPPMGWYPWNMFGEEPQNEKLIREIADALVASGMKDAGYAYVGPDEGICFSRGADGRLTSNLQRYPSGLRGLGDYIHGLGLKYALYTDAGSKTCSTAMPGAKGHETEDMRSFADWRADYIKIDWCNSEGQDVVKSYSLLGEAQRAAGRPVVHSLCSWGEGYPWRWAGAIGHMWRTTADICGPGQADWARAVRIVMANERLSEYAGPGRWNDPDMMIVGMPGLTEAQNRSLFSLWCLMASPLIAGNDVRGMTPETIATLTNLEAIAVNQDPLGAQGRIVWDDGHVSLWAGKPMYDGSRAALLFYQGRYKAERRVLWEEIGFKAEDSLYVRDLWKHETTGPFKGGVNAAVGSNEVAFIRVSKKSDFPVPPIIVVDKYRLVLRSPGRAAAKPSGAITVTNKGSADLPLWKI